MSRSVSKNPVVKRLRSMGAKLLRAKHHMVWELPDGSRFVCSRTPSDFRAYRKALAFLARWEQQQAQ